MKRVYERGKGKREGRKRMTEKTRARTRQERAMLTGQSEGSQSSQRSVGYGILRSSWYVSIGTFQVGTWGRLAEVAMQSNP
eukprot:1364842-Amorphochlora_amoeboformis.AAC.1